MGSVASGHRMGRLVLAVLLSVCVAGAAFASSGDLQIRCRSSLDGGQVPASAVVSGAALRTSLNTQLPSQGVAVLRLDAETYSLEAAAPGYAPLATTLTVQPGETLPVTLWLDPVTTSPEFSRLMDQVSPGFGEGVFHGFVYDEESGLPLEGVTVTLDGLNLADVTDGRGYFRISYPSDDFDVDREPGVDSLVFLREGYEMSVIREIYLTSGDTLMIEDLAPGGGIVEEDARHKLLQVKTGESASLEQPIDRLDSLEPWSVDEGADNGLNVTTSGLFFIPPPPSIRVGTSCSCTSCSSVSVMSLETYVRRGLNDEWIASWAGHSLRSGAIAYRSYGSWYAVHPISSNYDICSTTCCQVNDSDTSSSTNSAVNATAGFLLQRNQEVFRSEYSAENNAWNDPNDGLSCSNSDLSCGDGFVGSPSAGWPCLADSVAAGHGCFGHGRGMSQWGTQRWAAYYGKTWDWISDHYYNASGNPSGLRSAYMTTPILVQNLWASPTSVSPGQSFTIYVDTYNAAELTHSSILLGASLYNQSAGWISDPPNDAMVSVSTGSSTVTRSFRVPTSTPGGSYDLVVSVNYDVTGDGSFSSADLRMTLGTAPGEISVSATPTVRVD